MRRLVFTCLLSFCFSSLFSQEGFDYQFFRLGVQYLYEDPEPTEEFNSPLLGMRLETNEFDGAEDPLYTYDALWQDTSSGTSCFQIVPAFAGWHVQQSEGTTLLDVGRADREMLLILNQAPVGSTWQALPGISAKVEAIHLEEFLGLTDSVKYIRFFLTMSEEPLAVPISISKSYGLLTGTFFWQLEATTTPLELVGLNEPIAGLQIATLDNTMDIPEGAELDIFRQRFEFSGPDRGGNFINSEQRVTAGDFSCDPVLGTRTVEFSYDEFSYKSPNKDDSLVLDRAFDLSFNEDITGSWQLSETEHDWLDAQPGELYSSDERTWPLFIAGRNWDCLGAGKQAHYVYVFNGPCHNDASIGDINPTGFYFAHLGGPYSTSDGVGTLNRNDLRAIVNEETECGDPFDFTNPLDTVVLGQAFDWQLFRPGVQYLYDQGAEEDWLQYLGMKLTGNGEETAYESYRGYFSGCAQQVPSFAGVRLRQEPELTTLLFYSDSLHLRPAAQIGETWLAHDTVRATIDSIILEPFLGLTDSVKYISFSHQTTGVPIGTSIRIGKTYGLLTGTFFYDLDVGVPLEIVGTSNESTGLQVLNFETLTAFEPGDEFHVKYIETMDSASTVYYLHREVQYTVRERQVFAGGNIRIHLSTNELSWRIGSTMAPDSTYRENRLMTMDFDLNSMPYLNHQPGQLYEEPSFGFGLVKLFLPNEFNCFRESIYLEPIGRSNDGCLSPAPFHTFGNFIDGLGGPYYQFVEGSHVIQDLRYSDNANGTCGTPINLSGLIDGVNDFHPDERIRLYPNPSEGRISLEVPADMGPVSLSVFSITGQRMLKVESTIGNRSISIEPFPAGIYTIVFHNATGAVGRKLVVKR